MTALLLGHFFGDYVFQPDAMAWGKSDPGRKGDITCLIHTLIYSFSVLSFILLVSDEFYALDTIDKINTVARIGILVFITHYPIDRWSLSKIYMEKILKRAFPKFGDPVAIEFLFNIVVYIIMDNGFHIFLMYAGLKLFFPEYI